MKIHSRDTWVYKVYAIPGKLFIRILEFFISLRVKNIYFFNPADFHWTAEIEKRHPEILQEFHSFYKERNKPAPDICEISEEQFQVVQEDQWKFIPLYLYGKKIESYTSQFPVTMNAIRNIPLFTTVFFSILKPGVKVAPHRGAYKGYLRYHLGVIVPEPYSLCGLEINNEIFHWQTGKSIIFDDTFTHSVWNDSDQIRVVLYVDFIRPLPFVLRQISIWLTGVIAESPYIQNALIKLNHTKDEKNLNELQKYVG